MNIEMETSAKFSIALYHLKTTISMRKKRLFEDGFRQRCMDLKETTIIVIYSIHQTLVLMGISCDESQDGSFVYMFRRFLSSEMKSFDGESHFCIDRVNDR